MHTSTGDIFSEHCRSTFKVLGFTTIYIYGANRGTSRSKQHQKKSEEDAEEFHLDLLLMWHGLSKTDANFTVNRFKESL